MVSTSSASTAKTVMEEDEGDEEDTLRLEQG